MKIKIMVILLGILALFGYFFNQSNGYRSPHYVELAHQITAQTANNIESATGLKLIGTGGGMMHDIQMMAMGFNCYHEVSIEEARKLVINVISTYLSSINENEEIRPYLHDWPFTDKNIEIRIWFYNRDGSNLPIDKIDNVSAIDGIISYFSDLPETYSQKLCHQEKYEEALQTIACSSENLSKEGHYDARKIL